MSDLNKHAIPGVLAFIKQNKKTFYKTWRLKAKSKRLMSLNWDMEPNVDIIHMRYKDDYNKMVEIYQIELVLREMKAPWPKDIDLLEAVWNKYHERFLTYLTKRVKMYGWPHDTKTNAILEMLARGWVHIDDSTINFTKYWIQASIAPLVWNENFDQHQDAIVKAGKVGINGYTECKIPKT